MKLKDQVIVVTGAAGLIGSHFCQSIADAGGIPIVADIDLSRLTKVTDKIPKSQGIKLDITSKKSIESVIESLDLKYGRIDGLVNNAYPRNKNYGRSFFEVEYADFCENLNSHVGGYFLTSQLFMKYFEKQKKGNIVNIASIYGVIAPKFEIYSGCSFTMPVEYAAIKSAIIHLSKYMAKYSKEKGIRVNCISPGGVFDSQAESFLSEYRKHCGQKGMLNPNDLNGALTFLLSSESQYMNGQNLIVDDSFTL